MSLTRVWLQTLADGLIRADQVTGIDVHQPPAVTGRTPPWLIDVILPVQFGSGAGPDWTVTALHRTLLQTNHHPGDAPTALARLLAQLDSISADGLITTHPAPDEGSSTTRVRFQFTPFAPLPTGQHTGPEYL